MNITSRKTNYDSPFWWARYVPVALLLLVIGALLLFVTGPVLVPLLLSFALAFMLEPLADWFQRRFRSSRNTAVLFALALATFGVLGIIIGLLPSVYSQFVESTEKMPLAIAAARARFQDLLIYAQEHLSPSVFSGLQDFVRGFQEDPSAITSRIGGFLSQGLFGLVNLSSAAIGLLIVPFFVYYLLLDMQNIRLFVERRIPERHRGVGLQLFNEMGEVVRGYVRGRFLIALILSVFYAIGLWVLNVPLWAAIGLIAGFIGIIPYIGIVAGIILALAFAALDGAGTGRLVGVVVVFLLAQPLEDYVLTPKLIGDKLDLHPMFVFIALIIAGSLFGVLGLVLAIPVVGVLKVFLRFFDYLYLDSDFYRQPALAGDVGDVQRAAKAAFSDEKAEADAEKFEETRERMPANKTE
ncbi:MAG TPA: AI-2E family transporter [Pyrinomonadaceae bacterium]|jgi:predicted PurR-regulated permease PerM